MRSFDCWEPQLSKKYRVDRGYYNILGSTIFKLFKSKWCRAAQLLGGFRRNLLIVSWATPTPGCTANFPGNWYSQPLILRPFGRSGQELPPEYQVESRFINFSVSKARKGYRQGPGSGNLGESLVKATISQRQYWYQNHRKITYKKTNFLYVYPLLVLRPDLDSSQYSRKVSRGIFRKNQKMAKL